MGFWGKAQRVVLYKVRTEVEARKKEVMDKQVCGRMLGSPAGLRPAGGRLLVQQHGSRLA